MHENDLNGRICLHKLPATCVDLNWKHESSGQKDILVTCVVKSSPQTKYISWSCILID